MNLETLLDALNLTVVGMGIVFVALIALSLMMYILPVLAGGRNEKRTNSASVTQITAIPEANASVAESVAATNSCVTSPEVIAVIASALAAYLGQTPENLSIISIRRAPTSMGPWAMSARREGIQN